MALTMYCQKCCFSIAGAENKVVAQADQHEATNPGHWVSEYGGPEL